MDKFGSGYRELCDAALYHTGGDTYAEVLAPWVDGHPDERDWLGAFAERRGDPVPPASTDDLEQLYALSRVLELNVPDPEGLSTEQFGAFAESLGLQVAPPRPFSPFDHEVVTVEQAADPTAPPEVLGLEWPGLTLGGMVVLRAGVHVRAGSDHLVKEVAETSTMYWAWVRGHRPAADLSHGWGSNSQWRTSFRRDYRVGGLLVYNADGKLDPHGPPEPGGSEDLTAEERVELLTHRCFVRTRKPHDDQWPYDDTLTVTG